MRALWVCLVGLLLASSVLADGAVFEKRGPQLLEMRARTGDQRGLIVFDGQRETLVVETEVEHAWSDMAWVLPTPTLVSASDACEVSSRVFHSLGYTTSPRLRRPPEWGLPRSARLLSKSATGSAAAPGEAVQLHETAQVGAYTISTLTAQESQALGDWLRTHDYQIPDTAETVFADYIERGWAFTAIRVTDPAADRPGFTLKPLALTFDTTQAVFPLLISSVSAIEDPTEVTLYVIAPYRMETAPYVTCTVGLRGLGWEPSPLESYDDRADAAMRDGPRFVLEYSRTLDRPVTSVLAAEHADVDKSRIAGSAVDPGRNPRLTRLRARILPAEMTADVKLSRSADQGEYRVRILKRSWDDAYALGLGLAAAMGLLCLLISRQRGERWLPALGLAVLSGGAVWLAGYLAQRSLVLGPVALLGAVTPVALRTRALWGRVVGFGVIYAILALAHASLLWVQLRRSHSHDPMPPGLSESLLTGAWVALGTYLVSQARGARPALSVMLALLASLVAVNVAPGPLGLAVIALILAVVVAPSSMDPDDAVTRRYGRVAHILLSGALACLLWWASESDLPLFAPPWHLVACAGVGLAVGAATYAITRYYECPSGQAALYALSGSAAAVFLLAAMCQ